MDDFAYNPPQTYGRTIFGGQPKDRRVGKIASTLAAIVTASCSQNPNLLEPSPTPNPNPTDSSIDLVVNDFDTKQQYSLSSVSIDSVPMQTNANPDGSIKVMTRSIIPGWHTLVASGPDIYPRKFSRNITNGASYTVDAVSSSFPMDFFDLIARKWNGIFPRERLDVANGTVGWINGPPVVELDMQTLASVCPCGSVSGPLIDELYRDFQTKLPKLDPMFNGVQLIPVSNSSDLSPLGTYKRGVVLGGFTTEPAISYADFWINPRTNEMIYFRITLNNRIDYRGRPTASNIINEIGKIDGFGEKEGEGQDSVFYISRHPGDFTPMDLLMGKFKRYIPLQTKSPYDTTYTDRQTSGTTANLFASLMPSDDKNSPKVFGFMLPKEFFGKNPPSQYNLVHLISQPDGSYRVAR